MRLHLLLVSTLCLAACGDHGGTSTPRPDMAGPIDPNHPSGDCPEPTGPGVQHSGTITTDETWTAADSPHIVTFNLDVHATLTIEPCAVVRVKEGYPINIGDFSGASGALVAHGTYQESPEIIRPVIFTADDPSTFWGTLGVLPTGTADLQVVAIDRAGNPKTAQGYGGALMSRGDDNRVTPIKNIRALGVFILNSASFGLAIQGSGGFTDDSEAVVVQGAGSQGVVSGGVDSRYAAIVEGPSIHTLPPGQYTGNTIDEILVRTPFAVATDEVVHDRGVPYQVVYSFDVYGPTGTQNTLTIEPGVTLKFGGPLYTNPGMTLGDAASNSTTRLIAQGTAEKSIRFTSGAPTPAPGDWAGIYWRGGPAMGNAMSHVTVEYGGGDSGAVGYGCGPSDNDSLLFITGWQPGEAFITNSSFRSSAAGGIVSGWSSDGSGPDLKGSNTFAGIANGCDVSVQKNAAGQCPGNDSLPDCY